MVGLKELQVNWNHHLCVELSADYLLVDRANLYQTGSGLQLQEMGFLGETQLKEMGLPDEIQLKEKKSSSGVEANSFTTLISSP